MIYYESGILTTLISQEVITIAENQKTRFRVQALAIARNIDNAAMLSRRADIAYSTALAIWDNKNANPNTTTLEKIATALKVSVPDLYEQEETQVWAAI
jgi:DNA-binding Xre family transcriptional regulator